MEGPAREVRRQQLGWGGAVISVLGIRKPMRTADGLPEGAVGVDSDTSSSTSNSIIDD